MLGFETFALLFGRSNDAHEHGGGLEIAGDADIVDGDKAGFADQDFASDHFADFALEQLADTLVSQGRHRLGWNRLGTD